MSTKTEKKLVELLQKRERLVTTREVVEKFVAAYDHEKHAIQVPVRLEQVNRIYKEFLGVQAEIEQLDKPEAFKQHLALRCEFEDAFCVAKGFLLSKADHHAAHADSSMNSSFTHTQGSSSFHHRLPKIDLPKFNGDESRWISFRDNFISMIHINEDIPLVNKLQYLIQSLEDPARKQFEAVEIQADNYATTWDALLKRYDDKRSLHKTLFRGLYDLPSMERESAHDLSTLVDDFQRHVRGLEKIGEPVSQWDTPLVFILSNKLDYSTLRAWEQDSRKNEEVTYEQLLEFLTNQIRMLKSVSSDLQHRQTGCVKVAGPAQKKPQPTKFIANAATSESKPYTPQCPKCSKQHQLYECPVFAQLAVTERQDLVNDRGLCWNCFRSNHNARSCRSKFTCRICQAKHHTLLHDSGAPNQTENPPCPTNPARTQPYPAPVPGLYGVSNSAETSLPILAKQDSVLLETVLLLITDHHGREFLVRALLDSASMSNFVSKKLAERLNIRPNNVDVTVAGLGESVKQIDQQITTTISSLASSFSTTLDFLIMEPPMVNLPRSEIDISKWKMPDVRLADSHFNKPGTIDILIGGECYHELHTGQRKPIGDGLPLLIETRFGWTITGKLPNKSSTSTVCCFSTTIRSSLAAPQLEAVDPKPSHSAAQEAGKHSSTPTQTHNGRYVGFLPRSKDPQVTDGNSRESAARRVQTHEGRPEKDPLKKPTKNTRQSHMQQNDKGKPHRSAEFSLKDKPNRRPEAQLNKQPLKRTAPSKPLEPYDLETTALRKLAEAGIIRPVAIGVNQVVKKLLTPQLTAGDVPCGRDLQHAGVADSTKTGRAVRNMLNANWECEQVSTVPFAPPPIVRSTGSFAVPDDARETSQPPPRAPETTKTGRALRNCSMRIRNANW